MLSHDKLLCLSLISNLRLPLFPSVFHTKWACFAWSLCAHGRQTHISNSGPAFTDVTKYYGENIAWTRWKGVMRSPDRFVRGLVLITWASSCLSLFLLITEDAFGGRVWSSFENKGNSKVKRAAGFGVLSFKVSCSGGHATKESRPPCSE